MTAIFKPGATALITGGASGIGYAFARLCRSKGMNIALVDNNKDFLKTATEKLESIKSSSQSAIKSFSMDVSEISEWQKLKSSIDADFGGKVDLLMLNAGAAVKAREGMTPWTDLEHHTKTYNTNVFGVLNGIATFLPGLQDKKEPSTIIITGSKQGITNPPGSVPAYNASKAMVKHLTEHLSHDLRSQSPQINVHLLIPGWVYTSFGGNAGPNDESEVQDKKPKGAWLASTLVDYAVQKIDEGKFYIVCPDGDVTEELDQARMTYHIGDVTEGRSALSRWDPKYKDEAAEWIKNDAEKRTQVAKNTDHKQGNY
ncbi:hypothetical protein AAFC00_006865 [Neodothiora populina]|uniref:Short chain dehydrogenase/reductase n=1 Tax=Neodothiora populina TaxID=2781224 RepID=A0ABR3PBP6_9PEZI